MSKKAVALEAAIMQVPPSDFLGYVDGVYFACPDFSETALLESAVARLRDIAPGWFQQAQQSIVPESVFAAKTDAPVEALKAFAESGEPYLAALLTQGAWGYLGGTPSQMHRAALVAASVLPGGDPYISMIEGILDSVAVPDHTDMGAFLVSFSMQPKAFVDGDCTRAVKALSRALEDERYKQQAAAQLLKYFDVVPPAGISEEVWRNLRDKAIQVSRKA